MVEERQAKPGRSDRCNVLFLCTGNSARSIMAECILNSGLGAGRFRAFSAGTQPRAQVNPYALELLRGLGYHTGDLRPKSVEEFTGAGAPALDFVFTVCDHAASEVCPAWQGQPLTVHWSFPDPAAVAGTQAEKRAAFASVYGRLERVLSAFVSLPLEMLDGASIERRLRALDPSRGTAAAIKEPARSRESDRFG